MSEQIKPAAVIRQAIAAKADTDALDEAADLTVSAIAQTETQIIYHLGVYATQCAKVGRVALHERIAARYGTDVLAAGVAVLEAMVPVLQAVSDAELPSFPDTPAA